jgi:hypothetical protein
MSVSVDCRAQYLTAPVEKMRQADHDATFMVKMVKGLPVGPKQFAWVDVGGVNTKVTPTRENWAIDWFAHWAVAKINAEYGARPVVLLPIPSSTTIASNAGDSRPATLASRIAALRQNTVCHTGLCFCKEQLSTREGGSRDPEEIYPELVLTAPPPQGELILLDDVMTTGGHMIACAWKIEDTGRNAALGLACGRTVHKPLDDPFAVPTETLDTT